MARLAAALAALAGCGAARAPPAAPTKVYTFEDYKTAFGKVYPSAKENARRRETFERRRDAVMKHNADPAQGYALGMNQFTDLSDAERAARLGRDEYPAAAARAAFGAVYHVSLERPVPAAFDWREASPAVITAVKNQGACGSCWAFASTEVLESHVALDTGVLIELSPQHLVSCAQNAYDCGGTGGCQGSVPELAFEYVQTHGLAAENDFPYTSGASASTGACNASVPAAAHVDGYRKVAANDADAVLDALVHAGPLAVNVDASSWHDYSKGIFDGCNFNGTGVDVDHVVQLVGYGSEDGVDYFTIRNSWGPEWGEAGYMRLSRHAVCADDASPRDGTGCAGGAAVQRVCGECGLLFDASYPLGARLARTP
ncbi:hypothetical protein M885DRAFT_524366 [Pelagophyceae sp. CCMP2097]|nr:hypothetical protein M885DRAFT_524366 [Pelagophyceae sp. CCMP2097]